MRESSDAAAKTVRWAVTVFFFFQAACGPESRDGTTNRGPQVDSAAAISRAKQVLEVGRDTARVTVEPRCFTRLDSGALITFSLTAVPYRSEAGELVVLTGFPGVVTAGVTVNGVVSEVSTYEPPLSMNEARATGDRPREERPGWQSEPVDSAQAVLLALDALVRVGVQLGDEPLLHCYDEIEFDDIVNDRLIKTGALVTWVSQQGNVGADTVGGAVVGVSVHGITQVVRLF